MTTRRYGPYTVETSNLDKPLFPKAGVTKGELIDYYENIAETMLTHMKGRPVVMQRFPDGIQKKGFYHKQVPGHFPNWIDRVTLKKEGGEITHVVCNNKATLVYLADQACITPHVWLSHSNHPTRPDRLIIDLDPSGDDFDQVCSAAKLASERLRDLGLAVYLQTTGSRGIHVACPIQRGPGFDLARGLARSVCDQLAAEHSDLVTVEQRKEKRGDRVYLDTGRNAYAQTMVTPYAVRARPGAPVATPIREDELTPDLSPTVFNTRNIFNRLAQVGDLWSDIGRHARSIQNAVAELDIA